LELSGKEQEISPYINSRYSPNNSQIHIYIERGELFIEIAIKDEGIGINKDEYPFVFQRFYRSESVRDIEGSGIFLFKHSNMHLLHVWL